MSAAPELSFGPSLRMLSLRLARRRLVIAAAVAGMLVIGQPAGAQDEPDPDATAPTTEAPADSTVEPDPTTTTTTTTTIPLDPEDPAAVEGVENEPVPIVDVTVPPRDTGEASRLVRQELRVAQANAVKSGLTYQAARAKAISLEAEVDLLEDRVSQLSTADREAVRRVAATKRYFEARAATAIVRGRIDDIAPSSTSDDPNDVAVSKVLLGSVLQEDDAALQEYLRARESTGAVLADMADTLVSKRAELAGVKAALIDARRANIAAQINLQFFSAGSEIVIQGFVFPVGTPNTFGNSFGAPRMPGTKYEHAHQGTDIMAPRGTPVVACERGILARVGTDVLGGNKLYVKGESGTYYYYAHLDRYADGVASGQVVEAGQVIGYVGDSGNAKGGPTHTHFEIHPDGGRAVNPYPLLRIVKQLNQQAGGV